MNRGGGVFGVINISEYLGRGMSKVNYDFPKMGRGGFNLRIL